jgi:hypothetical protein
MAAVHALPAAARRTLDALERRFTMLDDMAAGREVRAEADAPARAALRRALAPLEAQWHDGDENLVRGLLEGWATPSADQPQALAARLLRAGDELVRIGARPQAWWFFLWEMESLLALVAGRGRC